MGDGKKKNKKKTPLLLSPLSLPRHGKGDILWKEREKSAHHPKQIRITDPVQLSHFTDGETETLVVAGTPPGCTAAQASLFPPLLGRLDTHPSPTEAQAASS